MSDPFAANGFARKRSWLFKVIAQIVLVWVASDLGYYFLLPALGIQPTYNDASMAIAIYYVFWIGIAVITFWPLYRSWSRYGRWKTFGNRLTSYALWTGFFIVVVGFSVYVLPELPAVSWKESWRPPEFIVATPFYFLPKSIDILFQQLLVVALVLALAAQNLSLRRISIYCSLAFGGIHVLLAFGDEPLRYVVRFMIAASLFGLLFPLLILRVPNGLAYSYAVHWAYYAVSVALPHIFLSDK
jgi:hypothetical protein